AQSRYGEAESLYDRALSITEAAYGPDHPGVAATLNNLAAFYDQQGRYGEAEPLYGRVLSITEAAFGPDHPDVARTLHNLALFYDHQGRYEEAEPLYDRALSIYEAAYGPDHPRVAVTLHSLAALYRNQGRYGEAKPLYDRALSIREAAYGLDHPEVAATLNNLALFYGEQGRYGEAEPLYDRALSITEAAFGPDHPDVAMMLNNLAWLYGVQSRYGEAGPLYDRALSIYEAAHGPDHPSVAATLNNLAVLYRDQGRYGEAEPLYERVLSIYEAAFGPDHPNVAGTLTNLAALYRDQGRDGEAEPLYERALSILDLSSGAPRTRISALSGQARLFHETDRPREAIDLLTDAIEAVESLRMTFGGDEELQAGFLAKHADSYEWMVRWQLESGEVEEALEFAERGRARVLLDQLAAGQIDLRDGIAPEIREPLEAREREARARLAEYQQRITLVRGREDLPPQDRLARIELLTDSLKTADEDFRQVYREIKNASPLWQDILTRGGRPVALSAVQSDVVGPDGVLLLYELGDEESYLFVIPPRGKDVEVVRLELGPELAERLGVKAGVLSQGLVSELLNEDTLGGLALREALVPDRVWERVRTAEEVVVIPDGPLYRLPFETLVTGEEDGKVRYWLDEGPPIRYGASLTVLLNLERRRSTRPVGLTRRGGILSVSDLIYNPRDVPEVTQEAPEEEILASSESVTRDSFERLGGSLALLPGTAAETDSIISAFGADPVSGPVVVLSGAEGTESALRSSLGSFRYLHLATHGLVDEGRSSLFAALALTPPPGRSDESTNDGFLQLHEIYGLKLPEVELAVLSACETNVGETVDGEGVFALSRGFLVAGAQRVIASQWAVNDASTAVLMATFFRQVAEAERRAEVVDYARALRTAQLAVKNHPDHPEWADPYYWAPFVLTGRR
ncbi:MAG: tetratricopeptide repeat protein, partial [Gemmatimonadota bacterium]